MSLLNHDFHKIIHGGYSCASPRQSIIINRVQTWHFIFMDGHLHIKHPLSRIPSNQHRSPSPACQSQIPIQSLCRWICYHHHRRSRQLPQDRSFHDFLPRLLPPLLGSP